mgnify:CR=1 FL=1|jgi:hypothetical protein
MKSFFYFFGVIVIMFFCCSKKEENIISGDIFINPVKLDSLLNENYYLKTNYDYEILKTVFDFSSQIANCSIKKYIKDEYYNVEDPDSSWEITYNAMLKINSIKTENYQTNTICKMIYDNKGRIIAKIINSKDNIDNTYENDLYVYVYYPNNNLKSQLLAKINQENYEVKSYTEYQYSSSSEGYLVYATTISDSYNLRVKKEFYKFDKYMNRLIYNSDYIEDYSLFKNHSSNISYYYENHLFPSKPTKIVRDIKPNFEKEIETYNKFPEYFKNQEYFTYDKKGYLLRKNEISAKCEETFTYEYSNNYKQLILRYDFIPKISKYKVMNVEVVNDDEKHYYDEYEFNSNYNIVSCFNSNYNISNMIKYSFDKQNNWLEKTINIHENIPNSIKKEYPDMTEFVSTEYYIRKINYNNFEKPHNINQIHLDKINKIKTLFLKKYNFEKYLEKY